MYCIRLSQINLFIKTQGKKAYIVQAEGPFVKALAHEFVQGVIRIFELHTSFVAGAPRWQKVSHIQYQHLSVRKIKMI